MLTIRNALALPVFEGAKVVAGERGLDNVIRWVHIVTLPDSEWYQYTKGGELVLTVGFGLRANESKQRDIIQRLIDHNIAGLVLSVGHYFDETPDLIKEEANTLGFPIIEVSGTLPFVEVTESIFTRIVNEQYALVQRAQVIHQALMSVVLNGGDLQDLASALSQVLNKSITIESSAFRVLASAERGKIDDARQRTLATGQTTPEIIQYLHQSGLKKRLVKDQKPVTVAPEPDYGLHIERIVAPVLVSQSLLGYMWIIADDSELTDLDTLAVEQAATVAALLLYKEKAVEENQRALRGDFFTQLLQAEKYSHTQLESQAEIFGFRLNRTYQVIVIESDEAFDTLAHLVESVLAEDTPSLVTVRENRVVITLQAHQQPGGIRIAQLLHGELDRTSTNYIIGVGMETTTISGIASSYEQAVEAVTIAQTTQRGNGVYPFNDLGLLHWIARLPGETLADNAYYRAVYDLDRLDSQLCETLEAFLDFGGSMKDAAERLYIHRNTLTYRLDRIEEITQLGLRDTHTQVNLYVALKAYRLHHKP